MPSISSRISIAIAGNPCDGFYRGPVAPGFRLRSCVAKLFGRLDFREISFGALLRTSSGCRSWHRGVSCPVAGTDVNRFAPDAHDRVAQSISTPPFAENLSGIKPALSLSAIQPLPLVVKDCARRSFKHASFAFGCVLAHANSEHVGEDLRRKLRGSLKTRLTLMDSAVCVDSTQHPPLI